MSFSININHDTPLAMLTVGQFLQMVNSNPKQEAQPKDEVNYVYGLKGIRKLFNVSHATAQRYKDTIIKGAVMQQGRKIIIDADKALALFNAKTGRN